jgi:hypothetical protein
MYEAQKIKMMTAIGETILPMMLEFKKAMIGLFGAISDFAHEHPDITKGIVIATGVIAATAVVLGGLLVTLGTVGMAISAVASIGAIGGLPALGAGILALLGPIGLAIAVCAAWTVAIVRIYNALHHQVTAAEVAEVNKARGGGVQLTKDAQKRAEQLNIHAKSVDEIIAEEKRKKEDAEDIQRRMRDIGPLPYNYSHEGRGHERDAAHALAGKDGVDNSTIADRIAAKLADAIKSMLGTASVNMDGQKVGNLVLNQIERGSMGPSTGVSTFDPRLSPLRPDYS